MSAIYRPAASAALLLCLGIATAAAQATPTTTTGNAIPSGQTAEAASAKAPASLAKDAIRVPAMGTPAATATDVADANASAAKDIKAAPVKPKKRARVVQRVYEEEDDDEVVYARPHDAPQYHYAPRPQYRLGHGIGPGFVYGW